MRGSASQPDVRPGESQVLLNAHVLVVMRHGRLFAFAFALPPSRLPRRPPPPCPSPRPPRATPSPSCSRAATSAPGPCPPTSPPSRRSPTSPATSTATRPAPTAARTTTTPSPRSTRARPSRSRARRPTSCSATAGTPSQALRADPLPGRRGLHPLPRQRARRASPSTRATTSTPPTPTTARASASPRTARPERPVHARRAATSPPTQDPVKGLDSNDEVAFMASDAGPQAPPSAALPAGHRRRARRSRHRPDATRRAPKLRLRDEAPAPTAPSRPSTPPTATCATSATPTPTTSPTRSRATATTATPPRATTATTNGHVVIDPKTASRRSASAARATARRSPRRATSFRYDGRWLMTQIQIADKSGKGYGPDLVDRWKARAFAQDPASNTPCCGYEEEDTNWGGSSILLGEKRRPGARDPRDVGRRLGHQRHPPRDLLPRLDGPEAAGCACTSSRRSTASTPSGTSTPGG